SLLSKESTLAFVVLAPAIGWYFTRKSASEIAAAALPLVGTAAVYVAVRLAVLGVAAPTVAPELMNEPFLAAVGGEKAATILLTLLVYLRLLVVPYPLTHDYYPYHVHLVGFAHPLVIASIAVHAL